MSLQAYHLQHSMPSAAQVAPLVRHNSHLAACTRVSRPQWLYVCTAPSLQAASVGGSRQLSKTSLMTGAFASASSAPTALVSNKSAAKRQVELLIQQSGASPYRVSQEMASAISALTAENPTGEAGTQTLAMGQGSWEVFYAPHIATMSGILGTRFQPIRYFLNGNHITSNVFYSSSIAQEGWLSASGTLRAKDASTLELTLDKFWVDFGSTSLRPTLTAGERRDGPAGALDAAVQILGKAGFLPQFALFPVRYLDSDMAVFTFPPLRHSLIAVRKVL